MPNRQTAIPRLANTNGQVGDELVLFDPVHDQRFHSADGSWTVAEAQPLNAFGMVR